MSPAWPHCWLRGLPPVDAVDHVPGAGARAPDGEVGLAVAVVVAGHRDVAGLAPLLGALSCQLAVTIVQVPVLGRQDGEVGLAVPVVVARHGDVACPAEFLAVRGACRAVDHPPGAGARTPDREVAPAFRIVVGRSSARSGGSESPQRRVKSLSKVVSVPALRELPAEAAPGVQTGIGGRDVARVQRVVHAPVLDPSELPSFGLDAGEKLGVSAQPVLARGRARPLRTRPCSCGRRGAAARDTHATAPESAARSSRDMPRAGFRRTGRRRGSATRRR